MYGRNKKKRSFLQNAKRYGKQGQRGRGTNIAEDQYNYLVRVLERWRDPFDQEEERIIFVSNVFGQMAGDERNFAGNQVASRVIELLLPHAPVNVVQEFCNQLSQDLRIVCTDQFAGHVIEKLMILCSFTKQEDNAPLLAWVLKVSRFLCNNFNEFSCNTYASHLLRTAIQCSSGVRIEAKDKMKQSDDYDSMDKFQFPGNPEVSECLEILQEKVLNIEDDLLWEELPSTVVQTLLKAYHKAGKKGDLKTLLKFLLKKFYSSLEFLEGPALVRLLETIIECSADFEKTFSKIHKNVFSENLQKLSTHPQGNFLVQRFFDHVQSTETFSAAWSELSECMEEILSAGYTGVVLAIVKASVRLKSEQTAILQQLGAALHCNEELEQLAPACIKMMIAEKLEDDLPVHLHGSLILQELFTFNKPIKVIRSLLLMEGSTLRKLFSDPRGSHILDKFVVSPTVGEKSRESLVRRLSGEFVAMSNSKHGSRAVQSLWNSCSMKLKHVIVEELAKEETILRNHQFGRYVHQCCAVSVWKHQKDEWDQVISRSKKEREMFKNIIGESSESKRKGAPVSEKVPETKMEPKMEVEEVKQEPVEPDSDQPPPVEPDSDKPPAKKKKKKNKSYLDDL